MKLNKLKQGLAALTLAAGLNCGDVINNNYGAEGDRVWDGQGTDNECNSSMYGAHMWNIYKCYSFGLHMREDCHVGIGNKKLGYVYSGNLEEDGTLVTDPQKDVSSTYEGLKITLSNNRGQFEFLSDFKYTGTERKYELLNEIIERYNGYVVLNEECTRHADDGCIYIPESRPYDSEECEASPYNVFNYDLGN